MKSEGMSKKEMSLLNKEAADFDAERLIKWSYEKFGSKLYALSSFGVDSAVMFKLIEKTGLKIPILTIDTGFWFNETYVYMGYLTQKYGLDVYVYSPNPEQIEEINKTRLWEKDVKKYHQITKLQPLEKAVGDLGVEALLSGVRSDQTKTRAGLNKIDVGSYGELRIHPTLNWNKNKVEKFIKAEKITRHPLYEKGYESVGDKTTTQPGKGRSGRKALGAEQECGIHIKYNVYY
jgi:phosphoadenosine phosphosulfate reductase